jgi:hypothetical protein
VVLRISKKVGHAETRRRGDVVPDDATVRTGDRLGMVQPDARYLRVSASPRESFLVCSQRAERWWHLGPLSAPASRGALRRVAGDDKREGRQLLRFSGREAVAG